MFGEACIMGRNLTPKGEAEVLYLFTRFPVPEVV
jgi:hypothetical protein